jgi:hypothetical protein
MRNEVLTYSNVKLKGFVTQFTEFKLSAVGDKVWIEGKRKEVRNNILSEGW